MKESFRILKIGIIKGVLENKKESNGE